MRIGQQTTNVKIYQILGIAGNFKKPYLCSRKKETK